MVLLPEFVILAARLKRLSTWSDKNDIHNNIYSYIVVSLYKPDFYPPLQVKLGLGIHRSHSSWGVVCPLTMDRSATVNHDHL